MEIIKKAAESAMKPIMHDAIQAIWSCSDGGRLTEALQQQWDRYRRLVELYVEIIFSEWESRSHRNFDHLNEEDEAEIVRGFATVFFDVAAERSDERLEMLAAAMAGMVCKKTDALTDSAYRVIRRLEPQAVRLLWLEWYSERGKTLLELSKKSDDELEDKLLGDLKTSSPPMVENGYLNYREQEQLGKHWISSLEAAGLVREIIWYVDKDGSEFDVDELENHISQDSRPLIGMRRNREVLPLGLSVIRLLLPYIDAKVRDK